MEQSGNKTKIINALILFAFLLIMLGAFKLQQGSYAARLYLGKNADVFNLVIETEPALIMVYAPGKKDVSVFSASLPAPKKTKNPPPALSYKETAHKLLEIKKINPSRVRFFVPDDKDGSAVWDGFKNLMSSWRYNPLLIIEYLYSYSKALFQKRTNIMPHEFLLLTLASLDLEITDFTLNLDLPPSSKRAVLEKPKTDAAAGTGPLIVEIFNASGRKGEALALTQYLRSLNEKGMLSIDVLQYDTNPKIEERTSIIDFTGRSKELKQLGLSMGLRGTEFFRESNPSAFCDAKIIIGKDFKMPK